jgi:hypothetical protein
MSQPKKPIAQNQYYAALARIRDILWCDTSLGYAALDPERIFTVSMLEDIAGALGQVGLRPKVRGKYKAPLFPKSRALVVDLDNLIRCASDPEVEVRVCQEYTAPKGFEDLYYRISPQGAAMMPVRVKERK